MRLAANAFGCVDGVAHEAVLLDLSAPHQSFDHRPEVKTNADAEPHFAEQPPELKAEYVFSAPTRIAAEAWDLSRRNVSTAQTRPLNSKASFAHQQPLR